MSLIVGGVNLDALNYTIKVPYNGSIATGGDSLNADLNIFYDVSFTSLSETLASLASRCAKKKDYNG